MSYQEYTVRVYLDGTKRWYRDGKLHRLDGPAIEFADGTYWYQNGHQHRLDGPAVEWSNGDKWWYQNGELHRLDGPAVEFANGDFADGDKFWYIEGLEYSKEAFEQKINPTKEMTVEQIAKELGYKVKVVEG